MEFVSVIRYAARLHRDGNNAGPSLTRAFGDFTGGRLLYYPDDDGRHALEQLREQDAIPTRTKDGFLLFDGNRAHSVEPFCGERYSLVFFSIGSYDTGPRGDMPKEIPYPTAQILRYYQSFFAGPRGYDAPGRNQSIREAFGYSPKPQMFWLASPVLTELPPVCVNNIAAYAGIKTAIRAVSKRLAAMWIRRLVPVYLLDEKRAERMVRARALPA